MDICFAGTVGRIGAVCARAAPDTAGAIRATRTITTILATDTALAIFATLTVGAVFAVAQVATIGAVLAINAIVTVCVAVCVPFDSHSRSQVNCQRQNEEHLGESDHGRAHGLVACLLFAKHVSSLFCSIFPG